jgi:hypothetical protein
MGQRATATRVKFWPGSPSTLGEKVASGLVLRFGTIDCVNDNLACFENGFDDDGSFLDVGGHRFYVTKPFPEEVTDVSEPLSDAGSSCSESNDLGAMVEVLALADEKGGDLPRSARPPLERPPPQEHIAPPSEQDILDTFIMDLHAPLDLTIDPIKAAENLERTCIALLGKAVDIEDTRYRVNSTLCEYNTAQGFTPAGDGPIRAKQVRQQGRDLGMELDRVAPPARSPLVIAKPTYSSPSKNLRAARYIATELAGLRGEELREKQARIQELLNTAEL